MAAGLPGKGGEALLFLSAPERRIRSQMFLSLENIFAITWRRLPPLPTPSQPRNSWEFPPQSLQPSLTTLPSPSSCKKRNKQGHLPEFLALSSAA